MHPFEYLIKPQYKDHFKHITIFIGPAERMVPNSANIEFISCHFSFTDQLCLNYLKPDVLLIECSPPNAWGYMSYSPGGVFNTDVMARHASKIIVQVNSRTPHVFGRQNLIHVSKVDAIVENNHELFELPDIPVTEVKKKIASLIVEKLKMVQQFRLVLWSGQCCWFFPGK